MTLMRAALHDDDLPIVICQINDSGKHESGKVWTYGDTVKAHQAAFCEADENAALVPTSGFDYGYCDPWHYDTAAFLDIGKRVAEAMPARQEDE